MVFQASAAPAHFQSVLPQFNLFIKKKKQGDHVGHTYRMISETYDVLANLVKNTDSLQYLVQMGIGTAAMIKRGAPFQGAARLAEINTLIDCVRTYTDVDYFVSGSVLADLKEKALAAAASGTLFLTSSIGGCLEVARQFDFLNPADLAAHLGKVSLLGSSPFAFMSQWALSDFCLRTSTVAYALGAVDSALKIYQGDVARSRLAQLAYYIASIVSQVFLITGGAILSTSTGIAIAGLLAVQAAAFGACWIYYTDKENKAALAKRIGAAGQRGGE